VRLPRGVGGGVGWGVREGSEGTERDGAAPSQGCRIEVLVKVPNHPRPEPDLPHAVPLLSCARPQPPLSLHPHLYRSLSRQLAAEGILRTARAISSKGGHDAVSLKIAEQYVGAFGRLAQKGNTVLLPANVGDPAAMVAQALSVFDSVRKAQHQRSAASGVEEEEEEEGAGGAGASEGGDSESGGAHASPAGLDAVGDDSRRGFVPQPWEGSKPL
jgi:hypothetical protein